MSVRLHALLVTLCAALVFLTLSADDELPAVRQALEFLTSEDPFDTYRASLADAATAAREEALEEWKTTTERALRAWMKANGLEDKILSTNIEVLPEGVLAYYEDRSPSISSPTSQSSLRTLIPHLQGIVLSTHVPNRQWMLQSYSRILRAAAGHTLRAEFDIPEGSSNFRCRVAWGAKTETPESSCARIVFPVGSFLQAVEISANQRVFLGLTYLSQTGGDLLLPGVNLDEYSPETALAAVNKLAFRHEPLSFLGVAVPYRITSVAGPAILLVVLLLLFLYLKETSLRLGSSEERLSPSAWLPFVREPVARFLSFGSIVLLPPLSIAFFNVRLYDALGKNLSAIPPLVGIASFSGSLLLGILTWTTVTRILTSEEGQTDVMLVSAIESARFSILVQTSGLLPSDTTQAIAQRALEGLPVRIITAKSINSPDLRALSTSGAEIVTIGRDSRWDCSERVIVDTNVSITLKIGPNGSQSDTVRFESSTRESLAVLADRIHFELLYSNARREEETP